MEIKFKKIKFKNDSLSFKRFNQIIFENKNIKQEYGWIIRPKNWKHKKLKIKDNDLELFSPNFKIPSDAPIRKEIFNSYYKGKLINGKYEGLGTEIILQSGNYMEDVFSFYKGHWKNGKKNGKGYWSNHHPLIGTTSSVDGFKPVYTVMTNFDRYYYGFWKNDKMHGKGFLEEPDSIFEGEFKNNKKWNGQIKKDNQTYIIEKGKQTKKIR